MASDSKNWSEQYRYMKRMHDRAIKALISIPDDVYEAEDTLHAYFQAAWSFKDWLHSDESTNLKTKTVNDFANTDYLKIVGDIATWKKHLLVNDKRRSDSDLGVGRVNVYQDDNGNISVEQNFEITLNGKKIGISAKELVEESLKQWDGFLATNNLILQPSLLEAMLDLLDKGKIKVEDKIITK